MYECTLLQKQEKEIALLVWHSQIQNSIRRNENYKNQLYLFNIAKTQWEKDFKETFILKDIFSDLADKKPLPKKKTPQKLR